VLADGIERALAVDAPDDLAQSRAQLVGGRQVRRIERLDADFGAVSATIDALADPLHAPIVEEARRGFHVFDAESDDVDAGDRHAKLLNRLPRTYSAVSP